jgi:two-component system chemotaxis response regulator CheY
MRILIIDDDYISRTKLKTILSQHGDCDSIHDGELALSMFENAHKESVPYELITVDIEMPFMNGKEVVGQIRKIEKDIGVTDKEDLVKIIMVSVKDDSDNIIDSFNSGCEGYIIKPVTPDKIFEQLQKLKVI